MPNPTPNLLGQGAWMPGELCPFCRGRVFFVDLNGWEWDECAACGATDYGDGWEMQIDQHAKQEDEE